MPVAINLYAIGVWFCVGLFTGAGWALGSWVVAKIVAILESAGARRPPA